MEYLVALERILMLNFLSSIKLCFKVITKSSLKLVRFSPRQQTWKFLHTMSTKHLWIFLIKRMWHWHKHIQMQMELKFKKINMCLIDRGMTVWTCVWYEIRKCKYNPDCCRKVQKEIFNFAQAYYTMNFMQKLKANLNDFSFSCWTLCRLITKASVCSGEGHQMHVWIFPIHEQYESDLIKIRRLRDERWHNLKSMNIGCVSDVT